MPDYYEPHSIVQYQGRRYEIAGVAIDYPNGVETVKGHDLVPIGGGPTIGPIPYADLTLISPPPQQTQYPPTKPFPVIKP
ncbi:hypothetical protein [Nocardia sp. NPDC050406]|uniref:hypothetical protein n=1 Tax=Nocardia sp. NPDC050406 TaxID=3364318 RepID=UPI003790ADA7